MKRLFAILITCTIFGFNAYAQECVDLGLSVNWATYNVGAKSIEDMGTCFMGGQILEYQDTNKCKKECKDLIMIHVDDYSGNPQYDAATAYWGEKWRTPTLKEWNELAECCTWKWRQYPNDEGVVVKGYEVMGPNGKTIFLPTRKYNGKYLDCGQYQCSTPVANSKKMYDFMFSPKVYQPTWYMHIKAADFVINLPVRAVTNK